MSDLTWDVAKMTKELIDDNWDTANARKPQYIELRTENSTGDTRKRVRRQNEYILFAEQQERGLEYSDIGWNTRTNTASCFAEISTADSRERREELIAEVRRIAEEARTRNSEIGTPGGWDNVQIDMTVVDDDNFGWWVAEVTFNYVKRKQRV